MRLRPWTLADVDAARLQHDEEIATWFGFPGIVPSAEQQVTAIRDWHESYANGRARVSFLVEYDGQVAGTVEVRQRGDGVGELSWAVFPAHRRRRVATTAVRLLAGYAFGELGLARLEARIEPANLASLRTAGRAGLRREGLLRQSATVRGERRDYLLLAGLRRTCRRTSAAGSSGSSTRGCRPSASSRRGSSAATAAAFLLCELTYKREWDLPGGVVDLHESPAQALAREISEELGVTLPNLGLRLVNWLPPWRGWDDACLFVFDLGVHDERLVTDMLLEDREILAVHWCTLAEAAQHIPPYLSTLLERLTDPAGPPTYLEAGTPVEPSGTSG